MLNKISFSALPALAALCCIASSAPALMIPLTTRALTEESDLVLTGQVRSVRCLWNADQTVIFTRVVVEVGEIIRGRHCPGEITVEYDGGRVGEVGLSVSDGPALSEGESVLLFLLEAPVNPRSSRGRPAYRIAGGAQGKYSVDRGGIARKGGFAVAGADRALDKIDNHLPLAVLIHKIKALELP